MTLNNHLIYKLERLQTAEYANDLNSMKSVASADFSCRDILIFPDQNP